MKVSEAEGGGRRGVVPLSSPRDSSVTMKCNSALRDLSGALAYIVWQVPNTK